MLKRLSTQGNAVWLALAAAMVAVTTALVVFRFRRRQPAAPDHVDAVAGATHESPLQPVSSLVVGARHALPLPDVSAPRQQRADLRLPFIILTLIVTALLFWLPPPYSTLLLIGYLALAGWIGLTRSGALPLLQQALMPVRRDFDALLLRYGVQPAQVLLAAALLLFAMSAFFFLPIQIHDEAFVHRPATDAALNRIPTDDGRLALGLVCLLLGGAALLASGGAFQLPAMGAAPFIKPRLRWGGILMGAILLWLLAEIGARYFNLWWLIGVPHNLQFALLIAALALLVWGMGGFERGAASAGESAMQTRTRYTVSLQNPWVEIGLLLAITLLGLGLRLWRLETAVHFMVDELNFAGVLDQFATRPLALLQPRVMSFSGIYSLWQSWSAGALGNNLTALRLVSALAGTLTIPAVWLLARALFVSDGEDERTTQASSLQMFDLIPLVAALLLATFPPHLHFSRLGINNVVDPLLGTLGFAFFAWGARRNRPFDYALAGVLLGLTAYFYEGGRLLYPALLFGWSVALVLLRFDRPPDWRGVVTTLALAALVALPFYYVLLARDIPLAVRMNDVGLREPYFGALFESPSLESLGAWLTRLRLPFLAYVTIPDPSLFYTGQTPLLLVYLIPPFFGGLALLVKRLRSLASPLLLGWLLLTALGSTLLKVSVLSPRFVVAFPALLLIAAFGLVYTVARLSEHALLRRRARAIIAAAALLLAVGQVVYYFGVHLPTYNVQFRRADPARDGQDAVLRSVDFPPRAHIHLVGTPPYSPAFAAGLLEYIRPDMTLHSLENDDLDIAYIFRLDPAIDHAFYIEPGNLDVLRFLQARFPRLEARGASPYELPPGEGYLLYYVAAGTMPPGSAP